MPKAGPHLSGFFERDGKPINQMVIDRVTRVAGVSRRPRPLDTPGLLFHAIFPGEGVLPGYGSANGWGDFFERGLEVVQPTGDHISMVIGQNLASLEGHINVVLDRYEGAPSIAAIMFGGEPAAAFAARQLAADQWLPRARQEIGCPVSQRGNPAEPSGGNAAIVVKPGNVTSRPMDE